MDRLDKIEMLLDRLVRKTKAQKMKALITPFPISNAVFGDDVRGSVLRYMFPCSGTILKGMIKLGTKPTNAVTIAISLLGVGTKSQSISITDRFSKFKDIIPVEAGECLDIVINSGEGTVKEVWIAFLWVPSVNDIELKSFLVDELMKDIASVSPTSLES
jgi:hypothetical protein